MILVIFVYKKLQESGTTVILPETWYLLFPKHIMPHSYFPSGSPETLREYHSLQGVAI